jgi:hypothetical protein
MKFMRRLNITLTRRLLVKDPRDPNIIIVVFLLSVPFPPSVVGDGWLMLDNAFGKEFSDEVQAARADDEYESRLT